MERFSLTTRQREELLPLTAKLQDIIANNGWQHGILLVYSPHTTAGLTLNESADPDVRRDICSFMAGLVPRHAGFKHMEGNSDAHLKTSLFSPHCLLIVENGSLQLGQWQHVYFCEWDGPRQREVWLQFLPS